MGAPKDTLPNLAARLRHARILGGLSARELDRLAGKTPGHSSLLETSPDIDPSVSTAMAYARVLGLSLDWLAAGEGAAPHRAAVLASVQHARAHVTRVASASAAAAQARAPRPARRKGAA